MRNINYILYLKQLRQAITEKSILALTLLIPLSEKFDWETKSDFIQSEYHELMDEAFTILNNYDDGKK